MLMIKYRRKVYNMLKNGMNLYPDVVYIVKKTLFDQFVQNSQAKLYLPLDYNRIQFKFLKVQVCIV